MDSTRANLASDQPSRRSVIRGAAGGIAASAFLGTPAFADDKPQQAQPAAAGEQGSAVKNGRIQQSVCQWCFNKMSVEELCAHGQRIGLKAIDLLTPQQWGPLKKHGLICSMTSGVFGGIETGLNRKENHPRIVETLTKLIEANAEAGYPNVICFSGNRHKRQKAADGKNQLVEPVSDEEGVRVCAEGLKQVMGLAEQKKVTVCMELLNSKVNHPDYMCDRSPWGIKLVDAVGSERFRLLYDIYHMQIMEGDVIATIKKHKDYFAHYHTAGVPGRHEIDESQELYYPAIMRAIADTGFKGYVAQEFIPQRDPVASLTQAVRICDV